MSAIALLALLACRPAADDVVLPTPPPDPCAWAPTQTWQDTEVPQAIRSAFRQQREDFGAEGVAYAILVDGEIAYAGAVGFADEENDIRMEPTTLLRNGSTLKMQTAALLLAQESKGLLSRDDRLDQHLPDFAMANNPGQAEAATLHSLISHQGGFFDYTPIDGPSGENALYNHAHGTFADTYWLMAEPGSFYNYSNPNFSLAGLVAQEAAGVPYRQLMQEDLWEPLCMNRSFLGPDGVEADGDFARATTTDWTGGIGAVRVGPRSYDHGFSEPAGFGWTSVLDMLHFAQFLMEGNEDVMPAALSAELSTGQVDTLELPDGVIQYGYGVIVQQGYVSGSDWREGEMWTHNGAIPGYAADIAIHPESGVAVAVMSNTDGAYFNEGIAAVFDTLVDPPTGDFPENSFDPATFDRYVGTYQDDFNVGTIEITLDGTTLNVAAPDLDAFEIPYGTTLNPVGLHNFVWTVSGTPVVVTFVDDEAGDARWFRHRAFVARKADGPASNAAQSDPERLHRFVESLALEPRLK